MICRSLRGIDYVQSFPQPALECQQCGGYNMPSKCLRIFRFDVIIHLYPPDYRLEVITGHYFVIAWQGSQS